MRINESGEKDNTGQALIPAQSLSMPVRQTEIDHDIFQDLHLCAHSIMLKPNDYCIVRYVTVREKQIRDLNVKKRRKFL